MKLTILMYHRVEEIPSSAVHLSNFVRPAQFAEQLAALRDWGYTSISLDDWLAYRARGVAPPKRPVILTFDDGYRSTLDTAWPLLRTHGFGATTFLVTTQIGGTNVWDASERPSELLSADDVLALRREGMRFGSHTRTHRPLTRLPVHAVEEELRASRRDLEDLLEEPITAIAYPFNSQNREIRSAARRCGYTAGLRGTGHMNVRSTDPMALRRIQIDYRVSLRSLRWRLFRERWLRV